MLPALGAFPPQLVRSGENIFDSWLLLLLSLLHSLLITTAQGPPQAAFGRFLFYLGGKEKQDRKGIL